MAIEISATNNGAVIISVRVQPRAHRTIVVGELNGALKVRLAAPPVDGHANDELIRYLGEVFHLPLNSIEITAGHKSKNKKVKISGISADQCVELLKAVGSR